MRINLDSPILRFLSGVFDTVTVSILTLLCCLPVVTVGPALTAMYAAMMAIAADSCTGVVKTYFRAFRKNFRQGLVLGLLLLAVGMLAAVDLWICWGLGHEPSPFVSAMRGLTVALAILYFGWGSYLLAGLAQFEVTNRQAVRNAAVWAFSNPGPTMLMVGTKVLCIAAVYILWYLCFPALWVAAIVDARVLNKVFGVRTPPPPESRDEEIYYE